MFLLTYCDNFMPRLQGLTATTCNRYMSDAGIQGVSRFSANVRHNTVHGIVLWWTVQSLAAAHGHGTVKPDTTRIGCQIGDFFRPSGQSSQYITYG